MLDYKDGREKELTISVLAANVYTGLFVMPITIALIVLFFHNKDVLSVFKKDLSLPGVAILFVSTFFMIIIHELLHGIVWMIFCENKYKSIKIGIQKETMTPYCHCKESLYRWQYLLGSLAPFIFLGVIPCIISLFNNNFLLFLISLTGIIAAGGDIIVSILVALKIPAGSLVKDHPVKIGCTYKI